MTSAKPPSPLGRLAKPDELFERWHLSPEFLAQIGKIVVLAAAVEVQTEQTIWSVEGHIPSSGRHWTDSKPISELIERLKGSAEKADPKLRPILIAWCKAAAPAFRCRNSIVHGLPMSFDGSWVNFTANLPLRGAVRKRSATTFSADEHTLRLIKNVFAILLRTLSNAQGWASKRMSSKMQEDVLRALAEARSIAIELEDLAGAVNSEKY